MGNWKVRPNTSDPELPFSVGYFNPDGYWVDYDKFADRTAAEYKASFLNGGCWHLVRAA